MDEWWELGGGLCRPVSLWSLLHISLLIKNDPLSPLYISKGWLEGEEEKQQKGARKERVKEEREDTGGWQGATKGGFLV